MLLSITNLPHSARKVLIAILFQGYYHPFTWVVFGTSPRPSAPLFKVFADMEGEEAHRCLVHVPSEKFSIMMSSATTVHKCSTYSKCLYVQVATQSHTSCQGPREVSPAPCLCLWFERPWPEVLMLQLQLQLLCTWRQLILPRGAKPVGKSF